MLVLSRKENQEIHLPDLGVKVRVLNVKKGSAKIGIEAHEDIRILRGELNDFGDADFHSDQRVGQSSYAWSASAGSDHGHLLT